MTSTNDAIAAFLAKGGKVTKVAKDATNGMTARQWYLASRDGAGDVIGKPRVERDDIDAEQSEEIAREMFGAARLNGASQSEALEAYNVARGAARNGRR